ncbi:MAG: molybdate ABC transporter substrate-binding protein [Actinomycetota bacterium]|nr:molybdate ABC transporter substrate-binding protein [Actinomycetota bacterium]
MTTGRVATIASVIALAVSLSACAGEAGDGNEQSEASRVTVFAASSLSPAFEAMALELEESSPDTSVRFNFGSSSDLATQLEQGARADVYASADEANMTRLMDAGLVPGEPSVLVKNKLEIIVAAGNPEGIRSLEDLEDPDLVLSLCNKECPAGKYAAEVLDQAGVSVKPDSLETEVRAVVTRLQVGEADAGIVYASDVASAGGEVEGVQIPAADNVIATYPIAELREASTAAGEFVDFALSERGRALLEEHGFVVRLP